MFSRGWGRYVSCGHWGSAAGIFRSSAGIWFPLALFLSFSPYMALKVFEGGFSQPPPRRDWEHRGREDSAHCQVPGRRTPCPCPPEHEALGSPSDHGAEIPVQIPARILGRASAVLGLQGCSEVALGPRAGGTHCQLLGRGG